MQWKARNVDFCTLTQRFGRAARDPTIEGFAVLLVEPACYNDDEEEDIDVGTKRKRKNKKLVKKSKRPRNDRTDLAPQSQLPLESQVPRGEDEDEEDEEDEFRGEKAEDEFRNKKVDERFRNEVSQEDFPDKDVEGDFQQQQQQGMRCWDEMNSLATAKDLALGT